MKLEIFISFSHSNQQPQSFSGIQQQFCFHWCSKHMGCRLGSTALHTAKLSSAPHCLCIPGLREQLPAGACCPHGRKQKYKRSSQSMTAHSNHLHRHSHAFHPVPSYWPKKITWPTLVKGGEVGSALWEGIGSHLAKNMGV